MHRDDYSLQRGTNFVRGVIARSLAQNPSDAIALAAGRWGRDSLAYTVTRAAVGASDQDRDLIRAGEARQEFVDAVKLQTALDRVPGIVIVPPNIITTAMTARPTAHWTKQGAAIPVSSVALSRNTMTSLNVGTIVLFSNDLLEDASPQAEALVTRSLVKALADGADSSFFDPANAGVADTEPASVTNAAASVASVGDLVADVQAALANFSGQLSTSAWICNPRLAADLGLIFGGKGVGADVGARGGTLAGLPLLTTEGLSADSSGTGDLILLDGASVVMVDEGATVERSSVATLELDDAPAQDGFTPTGPSGAFVSMWQAGLTAFLAGRRLNWRLERAGGCVTITACNYTGS